MKKHGRHEDDSRVEVEHGGHDRFDHQQDDEQHGQAAGRARCERAGLREEALSSGGRADE